VDVNWSVQCCVRQYGEFQMLYKLQHSYADRSGSLPGLMITALNSYKTRRFLSLMQCHLYWRWTWVWETDLLVADTNAGRVIFNMQKGLINFVHPPLSFPSLCIQLCNPFFLLWSFFSVEICKCFEWYLCNMGIIWN
jgi:hypothetical protein